MAQINKQPLLSLCIPIYNRLAYLERQLERMLEDKNLFEEQIQMIISDNCSEDELKSCCEKYQLQGLKLHYHRQDTNIGPDGNFEWCFRHAEGKYIWLLGSDDIPNSDVLIKVIQLLQNSNYGLVHLSTFPRTEQLKIYHQNETILADINVWITFISANIIQTKYIRSFDLSVYFDSFMIQVPAYLNACLSSENNALAYLGQLFEKDSDSANNGGYNLFKVFVDNLFGIYQQFVHNGMMSQKTFEQIKEKEYKSWLVNYVVSLLILRRPQRKNFKMDNAWAILLKYYGFNFYAYYCTFKKTSMIVMRSIEKKITH